MLELLNSAGWHWARILGWEVYAVGGFVRDILLGRPNLDLDLVVEGDGIAFAKEFRQGKLGGRVKEHTKFKTAVVILERRPAGGRGHGPAGILRVSGRPAHGGAFLHQDGPVPP